MYRLCNGQCLCIAFNVVYWSRVGFISTVKEVGILAFRSFLLYFQTTERLGFGSRSFCFRYVLDPDHRNSSVLFIPVLFLWRQRNASYTRVSVTFFLLHTTTDSGGSADSRSCYRMKWRTWLYLWKSHGLVALLRCSLWFCTCALEVICLTLQDSVCSNQRERVQIFLLLEVWAQTCPLLPSSQYVGDQLLNCFSILWAVILLYFHVPVNLIRNGLSTISHLRTNQTLLNHVKWS